MKKLKRDIIEKPMVYAEFENLEGDIEIVASSNKEIVDYKALKSAYNPLYPDAGKVVKIPEDYLYRNNRHHLKYFVIIDGKDDDDGNKVIVGYLGSSKINRQNRRLTQTGQPNELIAITKVIVTKDQYQRLIKKSRTMPSNRSVTNKQLEEIKEQSKKRNNINKSKEFRERKR